MKKRPDIRVQPAPIMIETLRAQGVLVDGLVNVAEKSALPPGYPKIFSRLWDEHAFSAFNVGGVRVFGNIRGAADSIGELFSDEVLTGPLVAAGFLPFGRPAGGSYDRICFDVRKKARPSDAAIVRMKHESILSFDRLPKPIFLAEGFTSLFETK